jgi:hypothetical protein
VFPANVDNSCTTIQFFYAPVFESSHAGELKQVFSQAKNMRRIVK